MHSRQPSVQGFCAGSLKLTLAGLFIPRKLANALKQGFPHPPEGQLLKIYQHTTGSKPQACYCLPEEEPEAAETALHQSGRRVEN